MIVKKNYIYCSLVHSFHYISSTFGSRNFKVVFPPHHTKPNWSRYYTYVCFCNCNIFHGILYNHCARFFLYLPSSVFWLRAALAFKRQPWESYNSTSTSGLWKPLHCHTEPFIREREITCARITARQTLMYFFDVKCCFLYVRPFHNVPKLHRLILHPVLFKCTSPLVFTRICDF